MGLERAQRTGRYVPLQYLLVEVGSRSERAYRQLRKKELWGGCAQYDVRDRERMPQLVAHRNFEIAL